MCGESNKNEMKMKGLASMHAEKKESWRTFPLKNLMLCFANSMAEVRRKDGEEYDPDSLAEMQASLDRN